MTVKKPLYYQFYLVHISKPSVKRLLNGYEHQGFKIFEVNLKSMLCLLPTYGIAYIQVFYMEHTHMMP